MNPFRPDTRLNVEVKPSPNHGERTAAPSLIVLHYTGMRDAEEALARLCSPGSDVSAHYVVFEDGRIVQCVPEARRAWHAGVSSWAGMTDINSSSIGIEIANPGHDHGYRDFPSAQIEAVTALCLDIGSRLTIRPEDVLAHSDIAPARKQDPGEKFPWAALHAAGVGHWVEPAPVGWPGTSLRRGDSGAAVSALQDGLRRYGYGLASEETLFGNETENVVRAFQRHFRPAQVDGVADPSTLSTLRRLLVARPAVAV
jgi:N-acetylmuramoyl-L-alanine amidase